MCSKYVHLYLEKKGKKSCPCGKLAPAMSLRGTCGCKWLSVWDKRGVLELSSLTGITLEDVTLSE